MYKLSNRSMNALKDVHPDLIAVVNRALEISPVDFTVVEGLRTIEKQRENVAKGVSQTMNSKHLLQKDGFGHAVDLYPYYDGKVQVQAPWSKFADIANAMKAAALVLGFKITWGGDWKSLKDGPHYQIES